MYGMAKQRVIARSIGLAALMTLFPLSALAALGGDAASVRADSLAMDAVLEVTPGGAYAVYQIQSPSGTVVRQYMSPGGEVFGIAWEGPSLPDLRRILGASFDRYVEAVRQQDAARGPATVELPALVVRSGGRMRAFFGQAYLPQRLPQGVSPEAIR
jgi:hypothetical protein